MSIQPPRRKLTLRSVQATQSTDSKELVPHQSSLLVAKSVFPAVRNEGSLVEDQSSVESALVALTEAKQAFLALQANHRQELTLLEQDQSQKIQELELALQELKMSKQSEKLRLRTQHSSQLAQAENVILQLRSTFLQAQKRSGEERRLELAFTKEFRLARTEKIRAYHGRVQLIKNEQIRLGMLRQAWNGTHRINRSHEERMALWQSPDLDRYLQNKIETETPDLFFDRMADWLKLQLLEAEELKSAVSAGSSASDIVKHLPPIYPDPENLQISDAAQHKENFFSILEKNPAPNASI